MKNYTFLIFALGGLLMKNDKYWQRFLTTGSVEDYLKYKQNEKLIYEMSKELSNIDDEAEVEE